MHDTTKSAKRQGLGLLVLAIPAALFALLLWSAKSWVLSHSTDPTRIVQFTASAGLDIDPSFSPDGSNVAYSSDLSGRFEIYVRAVSGGGREIQITQDGQQNLQPSWSPDGLSLAYASEIQKGIFVVSALGGKAQRLTDFGSQPSWSPDGTKIAFRSVSAQVPFSAASGSTIWVVDVMNGTRRALTQANAPPGAHGLPAWKPRGSEILFGSQLDGRGEFWTVQPSDGALTRVLRDSFGQYPIFSPDGRHILYIGSTPEGFAIMRQLSSGGTPQLIQAVSLNPPRNLAVDRSGRRIAYVLTAGLAIDRPDESRSGGPAKGNIFLVDLPR